jgi:hypothetical protein
MRRKIAVFLLAATCLMGCASRGDRVLLYVTPSSTSNPSPSYKAMLDWKSLGYGHQFECKAGSVEVVLARVDKSRFSVVAWSESHNATTTFTRGSRGMPLFITLPVSKSYAIYLTEPRGEYLMNQSEKPEPMHCDTAFGPRPIS